MPMTPSQLRNALMHHFSAVMPAGMVGCVELLPTPDRDWWRAVYRCPGSTPVAKRFCSADDMGQAKEVAKEVLAWLTDEVGTSGLELDAPTEETP